MYLNQVVVPEKIVGDPLSLERQIYEESMENLRLRIKNS